MNDISNLLGGVVIDTVTGTVVGAEGLKFIPAGAANEADFDEILSNDLAAAEFAHSHGVALYINSDTVDN